MGVLGLMPLYISFHKLRKLYYHFWFIWRNFRRRSTNTQMCVEIVFILSVSTRIWTEIHANITIILSVRKVASSPCINVLCDREQGKLFYVLHKLLHNLHTAVLISKLIFIQVIRKFRVFYGQLWCEQCSHTTTQRPTTATNHIQQNQNNTPNAVTGSLFS